MTCGQGISCIGQCAAIEASLCPTGNCTGDPKDCRPNLGLEEGGDPVKRKSYSVAALPSWAFKWCTPRCRVRYHSACCFHPTCRSKRRQLCSWMNYFTGGFIDFFLKFIQTTIFQATPVLNPAAFPMVVGSAKCRKSQFLTPLSWTVTPTPIRVSDLKLPQVYL